MPTTRPVDPAKATRARAHPRARRAKRPRTIPARRRAARVEAIVDAARRCGFSRSWSPADAGCEVGHRDGRGDARRALGAVGIARALAAQPEPRLELHVERLRAVPRCADLRSVRRARLAELRFAGQKARVADVERRRAAHALATLVARRTLPAEHERAACEGRRAHELRLTTGRGLTHRAR